MIRCKNCKHHSLEYECGNEMLGHYIDSCRNKKCCGTSPVDGSIFDIKSCSENRSDGGMCGISGSLFEPSRFFMFRKKLISLVKI